MSKRVLMAMSGGVDSSTAAALLLEQGYQVVGVTMQLCAAHDDMEDARQVAAALGFEHRVVDLRGYFREQVIDRFCSEYLQGRTPNPCIDCNRCLKFGLLHKMRQELGFDYLATGHYARIQQAEDGSFKLLRGVDPAKDQSYFLYQLGQEQLDSTLFPLGGLSKEQTRQLAAGAGLQVASKGESQDVCFIPDGDYASFIEAHTGQPLQPGPVFNIEGQLMGEHLGLARYTVGQRKGLNLGGGMDPLYVVGKDAQRNALVVGPKDRLAVTRIRADRVTFTGAPVPEEGLQVLAKAGYRAQPAPAAARYADGVLTVDFQEPVQATSAGQALVLYQGDEVLGGGTVL